MNRSRHRWTTFFIMIFSTFLLHTQSTLIWGNDEGVRFDEQQIEKQITFIKTYGGNDHNFAQHVQITGNNGYIMLGSTNSLGAGDYDFYLVRTNKRGKELWSQTFGGTGADHGYFVDQTDDKGYILIVRTSSFGAGGEDIYLVRTDDQGSLLWSKTFGTEGDDVGYCVQQTRDRGYILAGSRHVTGKLNTDMYLIKTDRRGNVNLSVNN
jgi:hypothetical protein